MTISRLQTKLKMMSHDDGIREATIKNEPQAPSTSNPAVLELFKSASS